MTLEFLMVKIWPIRNRKERVYICIYIIYYIYKSQGKIIYEAL